MNVEEATRGLEAVACAMRKAGRLPMWLDPRWADPPAPARVGLTVRILSWVAERTLWR
jgi:hypothetical protein